MIYTRFKKKVTQVSVIENLTVEEEYKEEGISTEQKLLTKHFKNLSESCQEILRLFYYRGLTVQEIVDGTHYKDRNTVKSHKSRCLKGLKEKIDKD
jgi:RNA polymerase sigma-70 factor (ECF subfamily)